MGCCHSGAGSYDLASENESLSSQNTQYMRAISMSFISLNMYAMAVKAIHVRSITKSYYKRLNKERIYIIKHEDRLSCEEQDDLVERLKKENKDLKKASNHDNAYIHQ